MATLLSGSLFDNGMRTCTECHRNLQDEYPEDICPTCKERVLFSNVKDYIRSHDVNEFDVAKKFNISLLKVKGWIREGRIEYKELQKPTITHLCCQQCGKSISFGTLCSECLRKANISGNAAYQADSESDRFRFLQK